MPQSFVIFLFISCRRPRNIPLVIKLQRFASPEPTTRWTCESGKKRSAPVALLVGLTCGSRGRRGVGKIIAKTKRNRRPEREFIEGRYLLLSCNKLENIFFASPTPKAAKSSTMRRRCGVEEENASPTHNYIFLLPFVPSPVATNLNT